MHFGGTSDKAWLAPPYAASLIAVDLLSSRWTNLHKAYQQNIEQLLWQIVNFNAIQHAPLREEEADRSTHTSTSTVKAVRHHLDESLDDVLHSGHFVPAPGVRRFPMVDDGIAAFDPMTGAMTRFGLCVTDSKVGGTAHCTANYGLSVYGIWYTDPSRCFLLFTLHSISQQNISVPFPFHLHLSDC
jgi:hypothetical protein